MRVFHFRQEDPTVQTPFFLGPRLYFRPLEREDAPRLATFINNPDVRRNLLTHRPIACTGPCGTPIPEEVEH
ncbi:hypothetical protein F0U61_43445 [Archangium violaceum]|uniref:GNAT family N-acetyltransferase n=1 Tax=Archangium violaceum TaxID=83451 RepID=UPI002B2A9BFC|nr:hypothetical protein F0U61_43445 [Archangium violaceum]